MTRARLCLSLALALAAAPLGLPAAAQGLATVSEQIDALRPNQYVWYAQGARMLPASASAEGDVAIVVSLPQQRMFVYRGGTLIGAASVSTGSRGRETPVGEFEILQKNIHHRSNIYSNAPMPYMQRLTWDGIALHAGHNPGRPASHGGIRLPMAFARRLYSLTELGGYVAVTDQVVEAPAMSLWGPTLRPDATTLGGESFNVVTASTDGDRQVTVPMLQAPSLDRGRDPSLR